MKQSPITNNLTKLLLIFSVSLSLLLADNCLATENPRVRVLTSAGGFTIELYLNRAPKSVQSILHYVDTRFYNGTIIHQVIKNKMLQGAVYDTNMQALTPKRPPILNEADNGLKNLRATVAMGRTSDPHSASARFLINLADNPNLDFSAKTSEGWGYAVFGKVVSGMNVVRKISRAKTSADHTPLEKITIIRINRI